MSDMALEATMRSGPEVRTGAQVVDPENLKGRLYSTLLERGVIDNLKTQLRTEILRQLRNVDSSVLENSTPPTPPKLPQRILNSLFIDYLTTQGYVYTLSVFTPECGMASQVPFTRAELLHLLHLKDPDSVLSRMVSPDSGRSLAWELLESLDQLRGCSDTMENGTQTKDGQGADFMESHLRSIEDSYMKRMDTEKLLPYHSLEERMEQYRREVDRRARAEIAAAVDRVRQFEVGAARMEEATRYRRQLEDDREDLERVHAERLEQLRCREDSQRERMQRREKELEATAYEHRQKILKEMETLKEREGKLEQLEELQLRTLKLHEERLLEKEAALKQREEEMQRYRSLVLTEAEEHAKLRRREVEQEYASLLGNAKKDRELLEVERARFAEERTALADEITLARSSKAQLRQLERQLFASQAQTESHLETIKDLEDRLAKSADEKKAMRGRLAMQGHSEADGYWPQQGFLPGVRACNHEPVIEKLQALRAADRKAKKRAQQEAAEAQERCQKQAFQLRDLQEQQLEWRLVERKLQATTARLQAQVREAADTDERATQKLEELTLRLRAAEREAADVTCLYRESKAALDADQVIRQEQTTAVHLLSAAPSQAPKPPKVYPLAAAQMHSSSIATGASRTVSPVRFRDREPNAAVQNVPLIGPQTAAFSGALQRLNELQREEQHMQHALDDFRARVRAGRAQGARAVERAAHMPGSFLQKQQEDPSSESESTSDGGASAMLQSGSSGRPIADQLRFDPEGESSGSSGKKEQNLAEAGRRQHREQSEKAREEVKQRATCLKQDQDHAGNKAALNEGTSREQEGSAERERSDERLEARDTQQMEEREASSDVIASKVEDQGQHDMLPFGNEAGHGALKGEPRKHEEIANGHSSTLGASSQKEQEGLLAAAASEGDEEVRSPDSVKKHTVWKSADDQIKAGLPPVRTANGEREKAEREEVKSPDTVKVLVRRREGGLLEQEDAALEPQGSFTGPKSNSHEKAPQEKAALVKELKATPHPPNIDVQTAEQAQQPGDKMQEVEAKGNAKEARRRRFSVPAVEESVLEEVAKLAEREVPNAESRTATPRDKEAGETTVVKPAETRLEALQPAKTALETPGNIQRRKTDGENGTEVHSETGSVSPVEVRRDGLQAWPSLPRLADVEVAEATQEEAADAVEHAFLNTVSPNLEVPEEKTEATGMAARATQKGTSIAVEQALLATMSPKLEAPVFQREATGALLTISPTDIQKVATQDPKQDAVLDRPIVSEGTAVEPAKPSIWERAQESARLEAEKATVASPVAEEIEEELEIDYEDATYSEGGFSNLSVPADERLDKERSSGSEGW